MNYKKTIVISTIFLVSACVSNGDNSVLQSAIEPQNTASNVDDTIIAQNTTPADAILVDVIPVPEKSTLVNNSSFASEPFTASPLLNEEEFLLPPPPPPRVKKTYIINGLASSVKSIGYGFTNLSKKIPNSKLHNYASFVESSTIIRSNVSKEIKAAYKADPTIEINLIGISFGANIVTWIAQELHRKKIPVNYLATLEGPAMAPIYKNVRLADNFSCTGVSCFRTSSKLSWGNKETEFSKFKIKAGHIALANHPRVHQRILSQIDKPLEPIQTQQLVVQ